MSTMSMDDLSGDDQTGRVGEVIDKRYEITGVLGRGGMGSVYRAVHTKLKRPVAIKLLHPAIGRIAEMGKRFEREAFAAARLTHPNCVTVSDFGELDDGSLYLVMELLDGTSLEALLDEEERLSAPRALHIIGHVLRGLRHAHKAGIVHRDIKPANIVLVRRDGDAEFARILDFGIAKLLGEAADEEGGEKLTQAGIAFGTPYYLSPEQAFGQPVDHRADLYSLSVLLFEMVTGVLPFDAEDKLQILAMHTTADVPFLRDVAPDAQVPEEVEAIIRRGMAKKKADRFADADEYLAAVEQASAAVVEQAQASEEVPPVRPEPRGAHETNNTALAPTAAVGSLASERFDPRRPGPRWLWPAIGGAVLLLIIVIAIATGGGEDGPLPRGANRGELLAESTRQLRTGKRCKDRKKAVAALRALGDPRAIPALRKARKRNYKGGFLGLETKNANWCLKRNAEEAIRHLEGK